MIARKRVQVFKPTIDARYSLDEIVSHGDLRMKSEVVNDAAEILSKMDWRTQVVGIDESNFFGPNLVDVANQLADTGKQVLIAGLDTDYMGRPFTPMPELLAVAESITKTLAICMRCGNPAKHTQRLVESDDLIVCRRPPACTMRAAGAVLNPACRSRNCSNLRDRNRWSPDRSNTLMSSRFIQGALLTAAAALVLVSCGPKAKAPEKTCELQGEVVRLDAQVRTAVIKHQKICDWMEAMTMEFPVRDPKDFELLKPGEKITATIHIGDPEFWISGVKPQGQ